MQASPEHLLRTRWQRVYGFQGLEIGLSVPQIGARVRASDEIFIRTMALLGFCQLVLVTRRKTLAPQPVPPTVSPSIRKVGWPTPTGTL